MADVTIPSEMARAAAVILRLAAMKDAAYKATDGTIHRAADLADRLDPPLSLRDEAIVAVANARRGSDQVEAAANIADDVLDVVRHHVLGLPTIRAGVEYARPQVRWVPLPDLLHLLNGSDND